MKTLISAAALSLAMTASAFAMTINQAGPALNNADVFNSDGERVGFVSQIVDNDTLELSIDGTMITVSAGDVIVREDGNDDADGKQYDVILSADAM